MPYLDEARSGDDFVHAAIQCALPDFGFSPVIGAPTRILFSFLDSGGDFEADCAEECIKIVRNALV